MKNSIILLFLFFISSGCIKPAVGPSSTKTPDPQIALDCSAISAADCDKQPGCKAYLGTCYEKSVALSKQAAEIEDIEPQAVPNDKKAQVEAFKTIDDFKNNLNKDNDIKKTLELAIYFSKNQRNNLENAIDSKFNENGFIANLLDNAANVFMKNDIDLQAINEEANGDENVYLRRFEEEEAKEQKKKAYVAKLMVKLFDDAKNNNQKDLFVTSKNLQELLAIGIHHQNLQDKLIEYIENVADDNELNILVNNKFFDDGSFGSDEKNKFIKLLVDKLLDKKSDIAIKPIFDIALKYPEKSKDVLETVIDKSTNNTTISYETLDSIAANKALNDDNIKYLVKIVLPKVNNLNNISQDTLNSLLAVCDEAERTKLMDSNPDKLVMALNELVKDNKLSDDKLKDLVKLVLEQPGLDELKDEDGYNLNVWLTLSKDSLVKFLSICDQPERLKLVTKKIELIWILLPSLLNMVNNSEKIKQSVDDNNDDIQVLREFVDNGHMPNSKEKRKELIISNVVNKLNGPVEGALKYVVNQF